MSASESLDRILITNLRLALAQKHAAECHLLGVQRDQLLRELNQRRYDHSPKTRVRG